MASPVPPTGDAIYLYCFTLPSVAVPVATGVDENFPVRLHAHGELAAVVSGVEVRDFTGDQGENNLRDIAWLGPRACRHAAVLTETMTMGPVYPLPFGTLFSGLAALEHTIEARAPEIADGLRQVTGCQEWSVEGTLDRKQAIDYLLLEGLRSGRYSLPETAGRRHLEEQKLRRTLAAGLDEWLAHRTSAIQQELALMSRDCRPRRLLDERILHWAFLVPIDQTKPFGQAVSAIAGQYEAVGLRLRLTGPWPPYTFCQSTS